jgi:hypothetical protein
VPAGYSGTPLPKKLGIKESTKVCLLNPPDDYEALLGQLPPDVQFSGKATKKTALVHLFVTDREQLAAKLRQLRSALGPEAALWVSWPKKASKVPATVTEDVIRELALPLGFVDIKVCAVSDVWSGLKLVVRKELR